MAALACPKCGTEVPESSSSCPSCGFAVWSEGGAEAARKTPAWVWWTVGIAGGCFVLVVGLGVLATLVVPQVLQRQQVAVAGSKVRVDIAAIEGALEAYAVNNGGKYPDSLVALVTPDVNGHIYIKESGIPVDPWKQEYRYDPPGEGRPRPRVYTLGRDGRPGGTGEDADVDNLPPAEEDAEPR